MKLIATLYIHTNTHTRETDLARFQSGTISRAREHLLINPIGTLNVKITAHNYTRDALNRVPGDHCCESAQKLTLQPRDRNALLNTTHTSKAVRSTKRASKRYFVPRRGCTNRNAQPNSCSSKPPQTTVFSACAEPASSCARYRRSNPHGMPITSMDDGRTVLSILRTARW